jgi:hypothetical protein
MVGRWATGGENELKCHTYPMVLWSQANLAPSPVASKLFLSCTSLLICEMDLTLDIAVGVLQGAV